MSKEYGGDAKAAAAIAKKVVDHLLWIAPGWESEESCLATCPCQGRRLARDDGPLARHAAAAFDVQRFARFVVDSH
jgi:hypothetical protein